ALKEENQSLIIQYKDGYGKKIEELGATIAGLQEKIKEKEEAVAVKDDEFIDLKDKNDRLFKQLNQLRSDKDVLVQEVDRLRTQLAETENSVSSRIEQTKLPLQTSLKFLEKRMLETENILEQKEKEIEELLNRQQQLIEEIENLRDSVSVSKLDI
ncbi:MAG: hypothetical protein KC684_09785, partial [Candidatus Omnitrophica bacterium]|nr:hypothetical protein [Candidatus Omnitrophota bacterium]